MAKSAAKSTKLAALVTPILELIITWQGQGRRVSAAGGQKCWKGQISIFIVSHFLNEEK